MRRPFSRKIAIKSGKVPAGTRIYAIGDVHGRADLLERTFSNIDQHLKAYPIANAIEIMLGDYIDRGPRSDQVIELLTSRSVHRQTICLLGNHETYLLEFLRDPASLAEWQRYGGLETLMAYGLAPSLKSSADDQKNLAALLAKRLPAHHHDFLMTLPLWFNCGDYFFAHAGVRPGIALSDQRAEDLLMIRQEFLLYKGSFGKIVVHGHTPVREPEIYDNRINLDTGAFATGRLTCAVLENDDVMFL
jgi:serine/threonine protein phosphatase 1